MPFDILIRYTLLLLFMPQPFTDQNKEDLFRKWVHEYSDILYSHAILRGFDRDEAKDLIQDTFYSAWKNMDGFEGKASVKNWLFVILKNKITDLYRKNLKYGKVQISEEDGYFDETGHWTKSTFPKALIIDPSHHSESSDLIQILENCSSKLNKIHKTVFFMKYVDEMESDVICGELSISPNNYWTILHRAKVQLRSCIEKHWLLIKGL